MTRIETANAQGQLNGYVIPLWSVLTDTFTPDQVYLTAIYPHMSKGPHLHKIRCGRFVCIKGNVTIIYRDENGQYHFRQTGESHKHAMVQVRPGWPAEIRNGGSETALVLNMPTPAWSKDEPDEWPAEDWRPNGYQHYDSGCNCVMDLLLAESVKSCPNG